MLGPHRLLRYRVVPDDGGRPMGRGAVVRGSSEALGLWLAGRTGGRARPRVRAAVGRCDGRSQARPMRAQHRRRHAVVAAGQHGGPLDVDLVEVAVGPLVPRSLGDAVRVAVGLDAGHR